VQFAVRAASSEQYALRFSGGEDEDDVLSYTILLYTLNCWVVVTTVVWNAAPPVNSARGSGAWGRDGCG